MPTVRVLFGAALAGLLAAAVPAPAGEEPDPAAAAARLFAAQCAPCHALPDPGLATDAAWIDQVHRTA